MNQMISNICNRSSSNIKYNDALKFYNKVCFCDGVLV